MKKIVITIFIFAILAAVGFSMLSGDEQSSSLEFVLNSDGSAYAVNGMGSHKGGFLEIPSSYNGKPVTVIGERAFENVKSISSLSIPGSVTSVGKFAFSGCTGLKSAELASGVKNIELGAFYNCTYMKSIGLPSTISTIGDWAFFNCSGLTAVELSSSSLSLGVGAFSSCSSLEKLTLGKGVKDIPQYAFADCCRLNTLTFSSTLKSIGEYAFADCYGLKTMYMPGKAPSVNAQGFYGVSASVRYSCNDASWDSFEQKDYGGKLSWKKHIAIAHVDRVEPTESVPGNIEHWICKDCGQRFADSAGEYPLASKEYIIPALKYVRGDVDSNGKIDEDDAILSLYHLYFGDKYPVNQNLDFNGDGKQDEDDVIYLLYHIYFKDKYPLKGA